MSGHEIKCIHINMTTVVDHHLIVCKKIVNVIMFDGKLDFKVQLVDLSTKRKDILKCWIMKKKTFIGDIFEHVVKMFPIFISITLHFKKYNCL